MLQCLGRGQPFPTIQERTERSIRGTEGLASSEQHLRRVLDKKLLDKIFRFIADHIERFVLEIVVHF